MFNELLAACHWNDSYGQLILHFPSLGSHILGHPLRELLGRSQGKEEYCEYNSNVLEVQLYAQM